MDRNNPRIVNAWCMYDWANSVHGLVIVSSIFPVYFTATARSAAGSEMVSFFGWTVKNSVLFSYSVAASFLMVALMIPFCTAIADYMGRRKWFMKFFCYMGSMSCAFLFFFQRDTLEWSVIAFMLSMIGWSGSIVFYNSFLPLIATEDNFDRFSARGYAFGYVGSVLLLLFNLSMILVPGLFGITDSTLPARISFLSVGIWWIAFAQIPFYYLKEDPKTTVPGKSVIFRGYEELIKVVREISDQKNVKQFLPAFFVFSTGVQTVMYVAALFGASELKLPDDNLIATILIIQVIAIPGSYLFSGLSGRFGNIRALMAAVVVWIGICVAAYYVTTGNGFYLLAAVVGLVMGGIQSLSRATFSKLIPAQTKDTSVYFSFYDVCEKLSIVFGTFAYGLIEQLTGSMRNSILSIGLIFVLGLLLLFRIPSRKSYRTVVR